MKRLAIFVEGQTELIFLSRLIVEIAGVKKVHVVQEQAIVRNGKRAFKAISGVSSIDSSKEYYVLIRDCGSDSKVKSDIKDNCKNLTEKKYDKILGLRDTYPLKHAEIPKLIEGLKFGMPTRYIPIHITLAIMEVEAWFLAESNHLQKLHINLNVKTIFNATGLDLTTYDVECFPHPSETLDQIYHLAGLSYEKNRAKVQRTVDAIDYANLYLNVPARVKSFNRFVSQIDSFLT